jgi:hypothetical protein
MKFVLLLRDCLFWEAIAIWWGGCMMDFQGIPTEIVGSSNVEAIRFVDEGTIRQSTCVCLNESRVRPSLQSKNP